MIICIPENHDPKRGYAGKVFGTAAPVTKLCFGEFSKSFPEVDIAGIP
jgi:hypothetical protein